ncbi:hypothetical protein [Hymenobacter actinosclerus]|uniref:Uncharacterized protein n=1 Tax=Hymenobacter actinosclerus TaxID=82805 RepID=A0A1I0J8U2_9BACT|nr:hypothetical protein [Hymenobacter actinosclerus]SEU05662.1 hypothetical protein SAMN04487998_3677 [Hymenobacter actinosclerus]
MRHDPATVLLYRPVGQAELDLVAASNWLEFPLKLPEPPVFYLAPPGSAAGLPGAGPGYLLRLAVDADYVAHFEAAAPAAAEPAELRVPTAELAEFNRRITGRIEVAGLLGAE